MDGLGESRPQGLLQQAGRRIQLIIRSLGVFPPQHRELLVQFSKQGFAGGGVNVDAQFAVSKTLDVKKSQVGLTFIRDSTARHESFTERAPKLGGLVEFYRSKDRVRWSPTGINVPDYPKLAQLWWQQIGDVNSGAFTPQQAMDRLASEMDQIMGRMQAADEANKTYGGCGPRMNAEKDPSEWLGKADGPKAKIENEKEQGVTIAYDEIIKQWTQ